MTVTRFGDPDFAQLTEFMKKPRSTVMMTFSRDPHLGMTDKSFSGSAVVFQATVTFVDQRTAALTPGPRGTMTQIDRAALAVARYAPGVARLAFRVRRASRRPRPSHRE